MPFVDGVRCSFRGEDAGNADSQAIGTTEDAASGRAARPGGTTCIPPIPPRVRIVLVAAAGMAERPQRDRGRALRRHRGVVPALDPAVRPHERAEEPEAVHEPKPKHASLIDRHGDNLTCPIG